MEQNSERSYETAFWGRGAGLMLTKPTETTGESFRRGCPAPPLDRAQGLPEVQRPSSHPPAIRPPGRTQRPQGTCHTWNC